MASKRQTNKDRQLSKPKISEADLERQCSDLLGFDGWRTLKTDPVSRREWGKGFGEKGMCDRLYIRYSDGFDAPNMRAEAEVMWIEWKRIRPGRRTAERAKAHQKQWIERERLAGALVILAGVDFDALFESFCAWYSKSGLLRRAGLCDVQVL